jgi:hypothetical protein
MIALLAAAAFAQAPTLSPEDEQRARDLYEHGEALYAEAKWDEAAAAFRISYNLSGKPLLLYNMASCYERMGNWSQALTMLKQYRPSASDDEVETIERRITSLEARVAEIAAKDQALVDAQRKAAEPVPVPVPDTRKRVNPVAASLIGLGVVGVGSGTFFTVRTLGARSDWTGQCIEGDTLLCPSKADPLVKRDNTSGLLADVSWLVAAGALTAGVVVAF